MNQQREGRWKIRTFMRNGKPEAEIHGPISHIAIEVMPVTEHQTLMALQLGHAQKIIADKDRIIASLKSGVRK